MFSSDKYNLIEKYFAGELSLTEQERFDHLLNVDDDFKKMFTQEQNVNEAVYQLGLLETSNALNDLHKRNVKSKNRAKIIAGGAAALLMGVTVFF